MSLLRIAAIDDQVDNVDTMELFIHDYLDAETVRYDRKPATPQRVADWVRECGIDGVLIDQDLHKGNFSPTTGAVIAAELYRQRTPTVLTTMYSSGELRDGIWYRRYLPAFLPKKNLENLEAAMELAKAELAGRISAEREAYRTVVRVDEVEGRTSVLVIAAYDTHEGISVSTEELAKRLGKVPHAGLRFMAEVNIGAPTPGELFISEVQQ